MPNTFNNGNKICLLVIKSSDIEKSVKFYETLGITFAAERHGKGPEHYAGDINGCILEIYPVGIDGQNTSGVRFGFSVSVVDDVVESLAKNGGTIVSIPKDSIWGRRAVVKDMDGHFVEISGIDPLNNGENGK